MVVKRHTHQVFDVLDKRTKATVGAFLAVRTNWRRLKVVTIDMRRYAMTRCKSCVPGR